MKKLLKIAIPLILILCIGLWAVLFVRANNTKITIKDEIYKMGETVEIGKNYFIDQNENPNGYTIKVNSVNIVPTDEFLAAHGKDDSNISIYNNPGMCRPDYIYEVNMTVKNVDNDGGTVVYANYSLINKSISLEFSPIFMEFIDEELGENFAFRLKKGREKDFTFVYVPFNDALITNKTKANKMTLNDDFYLCLSWYPKRVLIKLEA